MQSLANHSRAHLHIKGTVAKKLFHSKGQTEGGKWTSQTKYEPLVQETLTIILYVCASVFRRFL